MKGYTLVINHSVAQSVMTNSNRKADWHNMKEYTLVINHTAASSVMKGLKIAQKNINVIPWAL